MALGTLPAAVLLTSVMPEVFAAFRQASHDESMNRATAQAGELAQRLERRKETVRNIALLPAPLEMLQAIGSDGQGAGLYLDVDQARERFTAVMGRWFRRPGDVRSLGVYDARGVERLRLTATTEGIKPTDTATEPLANIQALLARPAGDPRATLATDLLMLRLQQTIRRLDGTPLGVLSMDFDMHDILGEVDDALWVDAAGTYVHTAGRAGLADAFVDFPQLRGAAREPLVIRTATGDEFTWLPLSLGPAPEELLWIGIPADMSAFDAWLGELRLHSAITVLVLVAILVFVVRHIADRLDEIKRRLVDGLHQIIAGERDVAFDWGGPPEIRQVAAELTQLAVLHDQANVGRRFAERQLSAEKEQAEITLGSIADGVLTLDRDGRIAYLNPAAQRLLGTVHGDAVGRPVSDLFTLRLDEGKSALPNPALECLRSGRAAETTQDAVLVRRDSSEVPIQVAATPVRDAEGHTTGVVTVLRDVAQERRLQRLVAHQASHDFLTGMTNRQTFEAMLSQAMAEARRHDDCDHWLCYFDLDQFKVVNDTCGHRAGDDLLKLVASETRATLRDVDVAARMGGDEFAVLLRRCSRESAYEIIERLRRRLSDLRFSTGHEIFATSASFGLVPIHADSGTLYDLLAASDSACYVAKERGRNRIHLADPHDEAVLRFGGEMKWAQATVRALEQDRLALYVQPIQPLGPGHPPHAEVLVRMLGDDGALVPPGAFIPAAERYNLMRDVDRWVMRSTLRRLAATTAARDTVFAVNLSAQSLNDDDFLGFALAEIDASNIEPTRLTFEITETAAIGNLLRAREVIGALKIRGVRFALDDFGSGLSSFAYLKNLPVDFLKIDGSFVRHVVDDELDRAFVASINEIGHLMGIATIAEYVENAEIMAVLRDIGVDYGQGYGIAPPMPFADYLAQSVMVAE
ncbi:MAG: EAL domain-containing protein [Actinomycetota bacterium]